MSAGPVLVRRTKDKQVSVPPELLETAEPTLQVNWEWRRAACLACLEIFQSPCPNLRVLRFLFPRWPVRSRIAAFQEVTPQFSSQPACDSLCWVIRDTCRYGSRDIIAAVLVLWKSVLRGNCVSHRCKHNFTFIMENRTGLPKQSQK